MGGQCDKNAWVEGCNVVNADDSIGQQPHSHNWAEKDSHDPSSKLLNPKENHNDSNSNAVNDAPTGSNP